jgi:beta-lactam-binding protein with PASTA domain
MLKKVLIVVGIFFVLFFLMNNVLMPWYVKHSDSVTVPKVTGMNFLEAKKNLENSGLEVKQGDVRYDESVPMGEILDQNPPADQIVKKGRRIYLTVCGGEQLIEVPSLIGRSIRDAKFTLEQRGLKLGESVYKNSNEFQEDAVIAQIVQPGSKVKKNTNIDLILSNGAIVGDLKVPDLSGKALEEAKKIILDSKLKIGKITYQTNDEIPAGRIVDQYPQKDKSANENTAVDLFVARKKVVVVPEFDLEVPKQDENEFTEPENKEEKIETPGTNENEPEKKPEPQIKEEEENPGDNSGY